jgi:hypothetical protein
MKAASLSDLRKELTELDRQELLNLTLHLVKFKKENKELLSYLLFHAHEKQAFVEAVKDEMGSLFKDVNKTNVYLAKKTLRKILRLAQKNIKFAADKQVEVDLLLFYCSRLKKTGLVSLRNRVIHNMYHRLLEKVEKTLSQLHEDVQMDFKELLLELK